MATDDSIDPVERTVQIAGNSTFVVSLPKSWAVEQNLDAGMSMYLYPHDDRLIAATETVSTADRTARIDAQMRPEAGVQRRIKLAYTTGCDRIIITGLDGAERDVRRTIDRTVSQLIGTTVETDTGDQLVITNLLDSNTVSLPQTIAQLQRLIQELHADSVTAVLTDDTDCTRRVIDRTDDVDRLFAFVCRGVHRGLEDVHELSQLGTDRMAAFREYRVARRLERIADHAEDVATVATRQPGPPDDPLATHLETISADVSSLIEQSLSGDVDTAYATIEDVCEAVEQFDQTLADRTDPSGYLYGTVSQRLHRTAEHGLAIAETKAEPSIETDRDRS